MCRFLQKLFGLVPYGELVRVNNDKRYKTANHDYFYVKVEYKGIATRLLMTDHEFKKMRDRAEKNKEDLLL